MSSNALPLGYPQVNPRYVREFRYLCEVYTGGNVAMEKDKSILKMPGVLDFVQVAAVYCALVEPATTSVWDRDTVEYCRRLLADIYARGIALPNLAMDPYAVLERQVREEDYEAIQNRLERIFGEHDRFLNAQMEEMKYSDRPVSVSMAEVLADIYQALADFVWIMRGAHEQSMYQAVAEVRFTMMERWGTLLLAALRQLHDLLNDPDFELAEDGGGDDWM